MILRAENPPIKPNNESTLMELGPEFYDEEITYFLTTIPVITIYLTFEEVNISSLSDASAGKVVLNEVFNNKPSQIKTWCHRIPIIL